jgi:hypothetical protein
LQSSSRPAAAVVANNFPIMERDASLRALGHLRQCVTTTIVRDP